MLKPEAARASQATQPATAAAALRAAAHARAPTEAARGQAPRAGYSPRHPQPGMAALRVAGCGIFAPATARAEPHEPRRATRPRIHSLAEAGSAALVTPRAPPASEDDVTARGVASRGPGSSQASAELSSVSRGLSVFLSGKFPVTPERSVGEKVGLATCSQEECEGGTTRLERI